MSNYLDIHKSVIISSPAGSGKTEKLARRYIALLKAGVDVERILAITFTDKAAAEMKQRILRILKKEDEKLFSKLLDKMSLMRVTTIHSFCGTLLRRFSFEAAIDPNYGVEDAIDSRIAWEEILYEVLMDTGRGKEGHEFLFQILGERGFRGLYYLKDTINYLFEKRPFSLEADAAFPQPFSASKLIKEELKIWPGAKEAIEDYEGLFETDSLERLISSEKYFLTDRKEPRKRQPKELKNIVDYQGWTLKMYIYWKDKKTEGHARRAERISKIFNTCVDKYTEKKRVKGYLDFSDLEYIAYKMLTENPEWANILYAFDEKTDHILVDEFQDTNNFQWAIINRLTEEWRSGLGAKRDEGITPTVFLVGDEKQSIYFFRGANVEVFHRAKEELRNWLGEEFYFEDARENFRSLPAIIDFTNYVFSRIMKTLKGSPPWMTRYSPFSACRQDVSDTGRVELILLDEDAESIGEAKQKEANILARRIRSLVGSFQITDRNTQQQRFEPDGKHKRLCKYMDIAILLRKRTHLKRYEDALRQYNIPFVAVKGIGFYQEPEVAMLRALIYFLSNPKDDYSLYILLKSPLFMVEEGSIIRAINSEGDCLFTKLKNITSSSNELNSLDSSLRFLDEWLSQLPHTAVSELIEKALVRTGAWRYFHEPQKQANVKKFVRLVEELEANGKSLFKIRDFLERTYNREEEPKANVNTEGMDAVRIMTIHAAKGLEFPVVFIPGLEEPFNLKTKESLVYEKGGRFLLKSEPEPSIRRQDEDFLLHAQKEEEEQKRLFYVAVTRAEDAVFLISRWDDKEKSFFGLLRHSLNLEKTDTGYVTEAAIQGLSVLTEQDVNSLYERTSKPELPKIIPPPVSFVPIVVEGKASWRTVTEVVDIRRRHGRDWIILGDIIHRIFEGVSKGVIKAQDIWARAEKMLESKGVLKEQKERQLSIIERDISLLKEKGIWQEIIMPRDNSFVELPFLLESEDAVYTGRIDRIIKDNDTYKIYDYKTFPVEEKEIGYLLKQYSTQLAIYKKAVQRIFNTQSVRSYIVFTHTGQVREVEII